MKLSYCAKDRVIMMEVQVMCEKKSGYRDFFLCPECGYTRSRFVKVVPDV